MNTKLLIACSLVLIAVCTMAWKTGDGFYVVLGYISATACISILVKSLSKWLDA